MEEMKETIKAIMYGHCDLTMSRYSTEGIDENSFEEEIDVSLDSDNMASVGEGNAQVIDFD